MILTASSQAVPALGSQPRRAPAGRTAGHAASPASRRLLAAPHRRSATIARFKWGWVNPQNEGDTQKARVKEDLDAYTSSVEDDSV